MELLVAKVSDMEEILELLSEEYTPNIPERI